jgi:hypothetical protein
LDQVSAIIKINMATMDHLGIGLVMGRKIAWVCHWIWSDSVQWSHIPWSTVPIYFESPSCLAYFPYKKPQSTWSYALARSSLYAQDPTYLWLFSCIACKHSKAISSLSVIKRPGTNALWFQSDPSSNALDGSPNILTPPCKSHLKWMLWIVHYLKWML